MHIRGTIETHITTKELVCGIFTVVFLVALVAGLWTGNWNWESVKDVIVEFKDLLELYWSNSK